MYFKTIDLHYLTEQEAVGKIILALYELSSSDFLEKLKIITGKGQVLNDLAIELIEQQGFEWQCEHQNCGSLIVFSK